MSSIRNRFRNPSTVYDFGSTITSNRRDTFLTYDAWGELVGESFASPHFVTGTSYSYNVGGSDSSNSRPFDNAYQYDALGRRISETTTNRNGAITTDDLYYDSSGNVISGKYQRSICSDAVRF